MPRFGLLMDLSRSTVVPGTLPPLVPEGKGGGGQSATPAAVSIAFFQERASRVAVIAHRNATRRAPGLAPIDPPSPRAEPLRPPPSPRLRRESGSRNSSPDRRPQRVHRLLLRAEPAGGEPRAARAGDAPAPAAVGAS